MSTSKLAGSGCELVMPEAPLQPLEEIEASILKAFRKPIYRKFTRALTEFRLIEEGDHIAVGVSGGKDSLLLAKLMQTVQRRGKLDFKLSFIAMDPGFNEANRELLLCNCAHLEIPVEMYHSGIFDVVGELAGEYPCYLCARMRRGSLYEKAQSLGANKLALGHHLDDVAETVLLNVLFAGNYMTMMPRLKAKNFEGMELIRPLYFVEETEIKRFASTNGIRAMNCGCVVAARRTSSKRREVKELLAQLEETHPDVRKSVVRSAQNVHMDAILGFTRKDRRVNFLEIYDEE